MTAKTGAAELGSAARPRRRKALGDTCPLCGGALWGGYFTRDGDGSDGQQPGDRWLTACADCSTYFA